MNWMKICKDIYLSYSQVNSDICCIWSTSTDWKDTGRMSMFTTIWSPSRWKQWGPLKWQTLLNGRLFHLHSLGLNKGCKWLSHLKRRDSSPQTFKFFLNCLLTVGLSSSVGYMYIGRTFRARIYEDKLSVQKPKDSRITPVSKHFTGKGHSVRNVQFTILEWCAHPSIQHSNTSSQEKAWAVVDVEYWCCTSNWH